MKVEKENSAVRDTHAGRLFAEGARMEKERVLASLPRRFADLHREAIIHIHDLDGWNDVGNCLTPKSESFLRPAEVRSVSVYGKIADLFAQFGSMIGMVGHRQTGGIGCGNFDSDMAGAMRELGVEATSETALAFREEATRFFSRLSTERLRNACENFYVTLNFGLDTSELGRLVTRESLAAFASLPADYTRPNLVFKVKKEINGDAGSPNYDLLLRACECTAQKMIPTYLLLDAQPNKSCDPRLLNIMGCRTRVYANRNGAVGSIGRGNIAAVSINLPRLALMMGNDKKFSSLLRKVMEDCKRILLLRSDALAKSRYLSEVAESGTWAAVDAVDVCRQGTYSVGFIGLSEALEILGHGCLHRDESAMMAAREILELMRGRVTAFGDETGLNFALLASPGEGISGRFAMADQRQFPDAVWPKKGYYTNSFHVAVDSGVSIARKLLVEGPLHEFATGGSISYVELREAPLANVEAIRDIIDIATACGVSYLGVNYPLDICLDCYHRGTFDSCPKCGSKAICRIRRVSGYLETLDEFATGKRAEESHRVANG